MAAGAVVASAANGGSGEHWWPAGQWWLAHQRRIRQVVVADGACGVIFYLLFQKVFTADFKPLLMVFLITTTCVATVFKTNARFCCSVVVLKPVVMRSSVVV